MPLSADEKRRLDEIERALRAEDPKFAEGHSIERLLIVAATPGGGLLMGIFQPHRIMIGIQEVGRPAIRACPGIEVLDYFPVLRHDGDGDARSTACGAVPYV